MIKHVSFDLWQTLIRPNPVFRVKRAEIIAGRYNLKNKTVAEIIQFIVEQDKLIERQNWTKDEKMPAIEMYKFVLQQMNAVSAESITEEAGFLLTASNKLFLEFPPEFLNPQIPDILYSLKNRGLTLSIGSNTGFVEGTVLRNLLEKSGILHYFSFFIFSDEINSSKPSARFFRQLWKKSAFPKSQILHIGDNNLADYQGAFDFGLNALLITNPNYTIDDICAKL